MPTTLREIIELCKKEIPRWNHEETCDTLKCGDIDKEVSKIACTFIATPDVIKKAAALGAQLIITHEPTFYEHMDNPDYTDDPLVLAKKELLKKYDLTLWRCHDSIHRMERDGIVEGMLAQLGWKEYQNADNPLLFDMPQTTLEQLAQDIMQRVGISGMRYVGDPDMPVKRIALSVGAHGWRHHRQLLRSEGVDVLVCGEQSDWQCGEYVRDSNQLEMHCATLVMGHCMSEEAGMNFLADWLRERVNNTDITVINAGNPYGYFTKS